MQSDVDPLLNASTGRIGSASPAKDNGTVVGAYATYQGAYGLNIAKDDLPTDSQSDSRPIQPAWEIGADEINPGGGSPPSAPGQPTLTFRAVAAVLHGDLVWTDVASETGYRVECKTGSGGYEVIATTVANVVTYDDATPPLGSQRCCRLVAYNADGDSAPSTERCERAPDMIWQGGGA